MKTFVVNCLLAFASILATVFLIEVALHFTSHKYRYVSPQAPKGYFQYDAELGYDITPSYATSTHHFDDSSYSVWSNSLGCFDAEYDGTSPYIYVTGDSMAWGFTPFKDKWGKGIEKVLGTRTLTCGVNGYGTRQELIKARRTLDKLSTDPNVIVVSYYENDAADDKNFPNYGVYHGYVVWGQEHCGAKALLSISPLQATTTCNVSPVQYAMLKKVKFELGLHSVLYGMFTQTYATKLQAALLPYNAWLWPLHSIFPWLIPERAAPVATAAQEAVVVRDETDYDWLLHESSFLHFKSLADEKNAKLLFVLIPEVKSVNATTTDPGSINQRVAAFLKRSDIDYVDLWQEFHDRTVSGERTYYWPVNNHLNVLGNQLTALLVSKYMLEHGYVESVQKERVLEMIDMGLAEYFPVTTH